jgi:hypothetical protein
MAIPDSAWLEAQFPELGLIKDPLNVTNAEVSFVLGQQSGQKLVPLGGAATESAINPDESKRYWAAFCDEFWDLVCAEDGKYGEVRKLLHDKGSGAGAAVIASVSAAVGAVLGVTAAALAPLAVICLYALGKVGVNAYCALRRTHDDSRSHVAA